MENVGGCVIRADEDESHLADQMYRRFKDCTISRGRQLS